MDEFNRGTDDGVVGQGSGEHAVDKVGEGGYAVHEDPEAWESGGTGEDTGRWSVMGFRKVAKGSMAYPLKISVKEKSSWAIFPAVSAVSIPAMTISVKVDVKSKKTQTKRNISAPRSWT